MQMKENMTALMSAFARAWHTEHALLPVHRDPLARQLLGNGYDMISRHMAQGIGYFCPDFSGSEDESLAHIVTRHLAPTPLGRGAFWEDALRTAVPLGTTQVLLLGAGYDTFPYRQPDWAKDLTLFEVDRKPEQQDKLARLKSAGISIPANVRHVTADLTHPDWPSALVDAGFSLEKPTFCALMGVVHYLPRTLFPKVLSALRDLMPTGSSLVFDYPTPRLSQVQIQLAQGAGEPIRGLFTFQELEFLLPRHGFLVYEHLTPADITNRFFASYNALSPNRPMEAAPGVNYCLAVRHR